MPVLCNFDGRLAGVSLADEDDFKVGRVVRTLDTLRFKPDAGVLDAVLAAEVSVPADAASLIWRLGFPSSH